ATVLAILVIGITTLYVILGGLYSVVITNVIQTAVLTLGSIVIAYIAWSKLTPELLSKLPQDWTSLRIPWRIEELAETDNATFELFGALVIVWVLKGLLLNAGGPAQMFDFQIFLASRNARDAAKLGAAWSFFLIVRWGMATGIALLALVGVAGITDPETVMPIVLMEFLPVGIRGIVIAGLLAAFMSTFSATVNSGASFIVRDIWQAYFRPNPTNRQALRFSHLATLGLVLAGIGIGFQADSIAQIWGWAMMALGAGVVIPNVLRWLCTASLLVCIAASVMSQPTDCDILVHFYKSIRPFGLWKPIAIKAELSTEELSSKSENLPRTILNVVLAMFAVTGMYLFPMYLVGHWYLYSVICLLLAVTAITVLKYTWYQYLPEDNSSAELH
ncbi:MAG: sodium:solute symporter family transporter, partial [Planctomycetota bacterium]